MTRAIDKQTMLNLIIEAKMMGQETGSFSEWLAEYLVEHLPTLTPPEIVYCQDCVYLEDGCVQTGTGNIYVCPDDSEFFCKFGRKKNGNTAD